MHHITQNTVASNNKSAACVLVTIPRDVDGCEVVDDCVVAAAVVVGDVVVEVVAVFVDLEVVDVVDIVGGVVGATAK